MHRPWCRHRQSIGHVSDQFCDRELHVAVKAAPLEAFNAKRCATRASRPMPAMLKKRRPAMSPASRTISRPPNSARSAQRQDQRNPQLRRETVAGSAWHHRERRARKRQRGRHLVHRAVAAPGRPRSALRGRWLPWPAPARGRHIPSGTPAMDRRRARQRSGRRRTAAHCAARYQYGRHRFPRLD